MRRREVLWVASAALASMVSRPAAHPGHGITTLVGTLTAVGDDAVTIDVREVGSGVVTRVRVGIGRDTKLRLKKETLASLTPWIGAAVVATADYEEGPDGRTIYTAVKVQVTPPGKKGR